MSTHDIDQFGTPISHDEEAVVIIGSGFGGSVWGLAMAHQADEAARAWRAAYARHDPTTS